MTEQQRRGWLLDTGWACGYVEVEDGEGDIIIDAAPIFRKFLGQSLADVVQRGGYEVEVIND